MEHQVNSYKGNNLRNLSLLMGLAYTLVINFSLSISGFQFTIFSLLLVIFSLVLSLMRQLPSSKSKIFLISSIVLLSVFVGITSNPLLDFLNKTIVIILHFAMIIYLSSGKIVKSPILFINDLSSYFSSFVVIFFDKNTFLSFFRMPKRKTNSSLKSHTLITLLMTVVVVVVFHLLFSSINSEYAEFIHSIIYRIKDIVLVFFKTVFSGLVFYYIYCTRVNDDKVLSKKRDSFADTFQIVLSACIGLFAIFSAFQARYLLLDFANATFKVLSNYVTQGFWELLLVSLLGYVLTVVALKAKSSRVLLSIFTVELVGIAVFSAHKLIVHQSYFGFKDQRILASAAVILIMTTFFLLLLRTWEKVTAQAMFYIQTSLLITVVVVFNFANLDLFISRYNPISYYVEGEKHKDYSYLLGNSFDNNSEWLTLLSELRGSNPPLPEEYYWGWYPSLCKRKVSGGIYERYQISLDSSSLPVSYLFSKYNYLDDKYASYSKKTYKQKFKGKKLIEVLQFNFAEYKSYLVYKENREQFRTTITDYCNQNSNLITDN